MHAAPKIIFKAAIITGLALLPLLLSAGPARAYEEEQSAQCEILREGIVTLRPPAFGTPVIWDASYGRQRDLVRFQSGVLTASGTILTAGQRLEPDTLDPREIIFTELNRRGRAVTEKSFPAAPGETPVKMIEADAHYLSLSNFKTRSGHSQIKLGWHDKDDLALKNEVIIQDESFDYNGTSLIPAIDGSGFVLAVQATARADNNRRHGMLIRIDARGNRLWDRAYEPGSLNSIDAVAALDDNHYIAAGHIQDSSGRITGWVLRLDAQGAVQWKRSYPRGRSAMMDGGLSRLNPSTGRREIILTGQTAPYYDRQGQITERAPGAAWVMALDEQGAPLWQRYYRRDDMGWQAAGLHAHPDGRVSIALNGQPHTQDQISENPSHIRLIALSPRGDIINDESYLRGMQARAADFMPGRGGERAVIASATIRPAPPEPAGLQPGGALVYGPPAPNIAARQYEHAQNPPAPERRGWVFVATPLPPYEDPCTP